MSLAQLTHPSCPVRAVAATAPDPESDMLTLAAGEAVVLLRPV